MGKGMSTGAGQKTDELTPSIGQCLDQSWFINRFYSKLEALNLQMPMQMNVNIKMNITHETDDECIGPILEIWDIATK